jgi:Na+/phosphate symporter
LESKVSPADIEMAFELEKQIDDNRQALRERSVNRMINHESGIYSELIYIDIINAFERISNHPRNIVQTQPHE